MNQPSKLTRKRRNFKPLVLGLVWLQFGLNMAYSNILPGQEANAIDPIVLRDLTLIRGDSIVDFNDSSILLTNGNRLTWDQVLKATLSDGRQDEFDQKLEQIGLPLFRLKSRIRRGDWLGAGEIAGPIYDSSSESGKQTTDVDAAYLVSLATMKSRVRRGDRAGALIPFVNAAKLQFRASPGALEIVGEDRIAGRECQTGLSSELLPIWFDHSKLEKIANQLSNILENSAADVGGSQAPGMTLYLASIKIELGQTEQAISLLGSLESATESDPELKAWQTVMLARLQQKNSHPLNAQTMLETNSNKITGTAGVAALYYLGINNMELVDTSDVDRSKALLTLLRIPALYGTEQPDLAAAAIYQSARIAELREKKTDAQKLRDELLRRYPQTYHGLLLSNQSSGK